MFRLVSGTAKKLAISQPVLLLLFFIIIVASLINPNFASVSNASNILVDASIYGVAALAMTTAIICGEFDLSLASNFAMSQILLCYFLNLWGDSGLGILAAIMCMLMVSTLIGCINALVVVKGKISSFIATLGMMTVVRGLALLLTGGDMIATSNEFVKAIGRGTFLGISYITYIFVVIIAVFYFVLNYTRFGRNIYATGGNYNVAKVAGIKVDFYKFSIFAILGLCAGIAGFLFVCLMRAGSVLYGTDLALTCVAATVIGGTPLTGGKGNILKTVVGIVLLYVIYRALAFLGIGGYYNSLVKGLILLVIVAGDAYFTNTGRSTLAASNQ